MVGTEIVSIMNKSQVKENFKYRLIGSEFMKKLVVEILFLLPEKIALYVSKHCWIISSYEDGWAFVLRGKDIKNDEFVIFLSDELLKQNIYQIRYTIMHEFGHVVLGHRNSIGITQTKKEIRKQEKAADEFVMKYLSGNRNQLSI